MGSKNICLYSQFLDQKLVSRVFSGFRYFRGKDIVHFPVVLFLCSSLLCDGKYQKLP